MTLTIIPRDEWAAVDPLWVKRLKLPITNVFLEYTRTDFCTTRESCIRLVKFLQDYNLKLKDNPDIRYNFLVGGDGAVYEGRGWHSSPRLPKKYETLNKTGLYIAFIGTYGAPQPEQTDGTNLHDLMEQARYELVKHGLENDFISTKHLEFTLDMVL